MANTSPRPTIGTSTGLVTYVDSAGNTYPALATIDFAATSGSGNQGAINLAYIDPNAANQEQPEDLEVPVRGRKRIYAANVPDQGNAGATTLLSSSASAAATSLTVASATGIPASGYVTGPGIAQTTIANPAYDSLSNPDAPQFLNVGTPYTISSTTVTLATGTTAAIGTTTPLFFSANPTGYWRYPAPAVSAVITPSAKPTANDTLTIFTPAVTQTYTFVASLSGAANEVLIGAALTNTMANLKAAINAASGSGTTYGTGTTANATVSSTAETATNITLASTASNLFSVAWAGTSTATVAYTETI